MQELHAGWLGGQRVRARARDWTIVRIERHPRCVALDLGSARGVLTLLDPFDRVTARATSPPWLRDRMSQVAAAILDAVTLTGPLSSLEGGRAPLALPPWQLAPAHVLADGAASRVLLADAVGLGKTIQAGLAIAALRSRGSFTRALVLTPASLRDQWTMELESRLGLHAWTADPASCRAAAGALPPGVSAWRAHPLVVASIDFVKQPDVLAAAADVPWDLVILDEAHNAGAGSDRRFAADALAARASRVLLVTATPHAGDDEAFAALCAIGARGLDDAPPIVIRRSREDAGLSPASRLRLLRVPSSQAERTLYDALSRYASQVVDARRTGGALAMAWLMKRAASSPEAARRSLDRRRALLASAGDDPLEPWLPFEDEVDERDDRDEAAPAALACPGLADLGRELRILDDLSSLASRASRAWRKGERLARWLASTPEPVIVFTEYRATLEALLAILPQGGAVATLHGGLGRSARADALGRFLHGRARVLLATDVAGEGLNLQSRARTVISVEMPWTPSRLRQRVGRVDRIGQPHPVRAVCLVSRDGPEAHVAARVAGRARRARAALQDRDATLDELALLDVALGRPTEPAEPRQAAICVPALSCDGLPPHADACAQAWLLRSAARKAGRLAARPRRPSIPWTRLRPRGPDDPLAGSVLMVFLAQAVAATGRATAHAAVPLVARLDPAARRLPPVPLLRALADRLAPCAARAGAEALAAARSTFERQTRAEIDRLSRDASGPGSAPPVQAGLFDRRALTEAARREAIRAVHDGERGERIARLQADMAEGRTPPPTPVAAFFCW